MAKAKSKKNAGNEEKKTDKKLPKGLRKFAPLKALMTTQHGRELLADALMAAATAAAGALTKKRPGKKSAAASETHFAGAAKDAVYSAAGALAGVVTEASRHLLPASLMGEPETEKKPKAKRKAAAKKAKAPSSQAESKPKAARKTAKVVDIPAVHASPDEKISKH
ncbi:hypothetical protein [Microvirga alba]|uniref:Uncharacterized protein n=1 Tax=Microvirga alba TaxID=2791025 RepID=A0A931BRZ8_9HYPH|nr:hypothetical protein [Microvirga alba]MBF9234943.1 hypothetical protein [Microvirga alba]